MRHRKLLASLILAAAGSARLFAAADDFRILEATERGDRAAVKALVAAKADVNAARPDGATPLAWAVHFDDVESVELLIKSGANVNAANDYGVTPLALACTNRNAAMVAVLLKAGANPNVANWTGETPLMTCSATGTVEGVKALLAKGADTAVAEKKKGQTALMWAVAEKHPDVVKALIAGGANVNARSRVIPNPEPYQIQSSNIFGGSYEPGVYFPKTSGGFTPLLFAAQQGDVESAQLLVAAGAKVDDASPEDGTPLVVAAHSGREKLALFLLDKGANPKATDAFGITALHYALYGGMRAIMGMPRRETDRFGWLRDNQPELVKALLLKGADPNARIGKNFPTYDYAPIARSIGNDHPQLSMVGVTPYMLAAAAGDVSLMRTLVEGRGDPKMTTPEKISGMMVAAGFGAERNMRSEEKALEALKLAVDLGGDVNEAKEDGRTALHAAAYLGWNSVVEFLVSKGANMEAKDMYGQTPLTVAMGDPEGLIYRQLPGGRYDDRFRSGREQKKTVELLLKLGAKPFTGKYRDRTGE